jgi:hypothetical protein
MTATKYQTGTVRQMKRSDLRGARVNPRVLSRHAEKLLRSSIKKHGLLGPAVVWNERLGELVSGHQRLQALDALEKSDAYELDVTWVSLDRAEHDELVVSLNNPNMQGEYDLVQLGDMFADNPALARASGFDRVDVSAMFPADGRFGEMFEPARPIPEVQRDVVDLDKIRAAKKKSKADARERDALDFHVVLVAQDGATLQRLLRALGSDLDARYVDAERVLRLIGEESHG